MPSLNKCQFIGNLGGDPEMRFTPAGNPVTTFNLACNRVYNSPEGQHKEETEWINVVAWNKQAESCNQFLAKGSQVYVEGRLHTRSWDKDGTRQYRTEIIASQVIFLSRKAGDQPRPDPGPEDVPF